MVQTTPKMSGATISDAPRFSPDDWDTIDETLTSPTTKGERDAIIAAADKYLLLAEAEARAAPLATALLALDKLEAAAKQLLTLLSFRDPADEVRNDALGQLYTEYQSVLWERMEARRSDTEAESGVPSVPGPTSLFGPLLEFGEATAAVKRRLELQKARGGGYPNRVAFGSFIVALKEIYELRGLKATATKASIRKIADSPFVQFCAAVFRKLPAHSTLPPYADTAFSEAVAKAIGRPRRAQSTLRSGRMNPA
jgi:hypothetical protein